MLSLCWSSRTVITECSHLLLSLFCLSCFPHRDAEESVPMAAEPGLPACNACASRTDGTCMTINISINSTLSLIYQFIFCFLKYYFVIVSCVCRWCVCWWSVSTCWSCCWMKQPCPEEWRWSFCQNRINKCALLKVYVLQLVVMIYWGLLFLCVVGPSPWVGLLFNVWLTGCCCSSNSHSVSFHPPILQLGAHRVN